MRAKLPQGYLKRTALLLLKHTMGLLFLQEVASKLCLGKQACLEPSPRAPPSGVEVLSMFRDVLLRYPGSLEQGDIFNCFEQ